MPLMHRKTPAAFKRNIEIEMEHGKPQKQAVAIAYSEKRKAQHKSHGGCMGPECSGCSDPSCYAKGGEVNPDSGETDDDKDAKEAADFDLESKRLHESDDDGQLASNYAEGGETLGSVIGYPGSPPVKKAEGGDIGDDDDELKDMMADELMSAFDSKDKKRIHECIEAMVLSAMDRE